MSLYPCENRASPDRAPWWAWGGPACTFVFFLAVFWPRPYAIPAGDGLTYYSAARHIAAEGRYYSDYDQRPPIPLVRHPPLFSILWGALLYLGLTPAVALWLVHSMLLCAMGAAGGALAFHITRSWIGPLLWTVFSCCWPGGDNWVFWIRPLTETGTAACFVIVCWLLSCALRESGGKAITWLLLAGAGAGLSMILKVTGVFCFPVVGIVSLVISARGRRWGRWWVAALSTTVMLLPYGVWALRNMVVAGTIEAGKISHQPRLIWDLMANLAADVTAWFLPWQLAQRVAEHAHPLLVMIPVVLLPVLLSIHAAYRRRVEALLPGACVAIAFVLLGVMMVTKFTEETRYWSVMLPSLALAALSLRPPKHNLSGQVFRTAVALFVMFCCARFAATRSYLWYATQFGFFAQQGFLAISLVGCLLYLHGAIRRFWQDERCLPAHLAAIVFCGIVAVGFWRFGQTPKPMWAFAPLVITGAVISLPFGARQRATLLRGVACLLSVGMSWWLGGWAWTETTRPLTIERDGVLIEIRQDVLDARRELALGELPAKFVSNGQEYLIDLFGDDSVLPLPWYRSIARFRAGLPQLPEDDERVKREWLAALRRDKVTEPFVMIMFPQFAARAYFYGPEDFESMPGLQVDWRIHRPDLHIADCQLRTESP